MAETMVEHDPWPARAGILAALGALLGLLFDTLVDKNGFGAAWNPLRMAAASFVAVGGIAFAFTLERLRWLWSALFAIACGAVVGLVFFWNGSPQGWSAGDGWRLFSSLLAVAIAAPLFQSARDAGRWSPVYRHVHAHAWTNIVLWGAAWLFVAIAWLLAHLLAELFNLIGIDLLREALEKSWFALALAGAALGGAIGLLRDRDVVLGHLQRVVTTVLSVLAPVLALGLVLFVLALPFTGLEPLWSKTRATTPILLFAIFGAFLLANGVIGNAPEEEAKSKPLRLSAMALAAAIAPLALVAAMSTWLRIDQYGLTPERLWASVFVLIALAASALYLWALARGRRDWAGRARPGNVRLAIALCALALLLATPLVNFGAISTRDQLARLQSGRIKPADFDWAALRFDFGKSGRGALERLKTTGSSADVRRSAARYLAAKQRYDEQLIDAELAARRLPPAPLRLRGSTGPVPRDLLRLLYEHDVSGERVCTGPGECLLFWKPGEKTAVAVMDGCAASVVGRDKQATRETSCSIEVHALSQEPQGWRHTDEEVLRRRPTGPEKPKGSPEDLAGLRAEREAIDRGDVSVREVRYRQIHVGGKPVGNPFE